MKLDIKVLKERYNLSPYKDNQKVIDLDYIDFVAFVWQLRKGHFDIVPFSNKSFLRYFATGTKSCIDLITYITPEKRNEVQKLILN